MNTGRRKQSPAARVLSSLVPHVAGHLDSFGGPAYNSEEAQAVLARAQSLLDRGARGDNRQWSVVLQEISRLCVLGQQPWLLDVHQLPRPYYNIFGSYDENATGPWQDTLSDPPALDLSPKATLFGRPVACPFGLAASALSAHPTWVRFYAQRGYNVITYRTVRGERHPVFPPPNWLFAQGFNDPLDTVLDPAQEVVGDPTGFPQDPQAFSMVNSFGTPSQVPEAWRQDIELSLKYLGPNQILIVSVTGDVEDGDNLDQLADSYAEAASHAEATGATAIELNLSSPNVAHGSTIAKQRIDQSPEECIELVQRVRARLDTQTKLVAKLGYKSYDALLPLVRGIASSVDAISGINALQVQAVGFNSGNSKHSVGRSLDRSRAGLSGVALRNLALEFTQSLNRLRQEGSHSFEIIAMGGVMCAEDAMSLYEQGANAVQSATAALIDWRLSLRVSESYSKTHSTALTSSASIAVESLEMDRHAPPPSALSVAEEEAAMDVTLHDLLRRARSLTVADLRGLTPYPVGAIEASLNRLRDAGFVTFDVETQTLNLVRRTRRRKGGIAA